MNLICHRKQQKKLIQIKPHVLSPRNSASFEEEKNNFPLDTAGKSTHWLLLNYWQLFENYDWIIDLQILIFQRTKTLK